VADMFPYTDNPEEDNVVQPKHDTQVGDSYWMRHIPSAQPHEIKKILDTQVTKRTHRKEYLRYLVKWRNRPIKDSLWLDAAQIQKVGYSVEELMEQRHDSFLP